MARADVVPRILSLAVLVVGALAVHGKADKPVSPLSPSEPLLVRVTGEIEGEGNPAQMQVTFSGQSFGDVAGTYTANPDGPLEVLGVRKGARTLRYYYCAVCSPASVDCCHDPDHDPVNYYSLLIYGGALEGKKETEQIVFPAGSEWEIRSKEPYGETFRFGTLQGPVIYKEHD